MLRKSALRRVWARGLQNSPEIRGTAGPVPAPGVFNSLFAAIW